jgi:hypothetical protein
MDALLDFPADPDPARSSSEAGAGRRRRRGRKQGLGGADPSPNPYTPRVGAMMIRWDVMTLLDRLVEELVTYLSIQRVYGQSCSGEQREQYFLLNRLEQLMEDGALHPDDVADAFVREQADQDAPFFEWGYEYHLDGRGGVRRHRRKADHAMRAAMSILDVFGVYVPDGAYSNPRLNPPLKPDDLLGIPY